MKETQRIEWKESWRDEFFRWVCGFANAEGGVLHIGRNDKGEVVGIADAKRLLEDLPNKTRDLLGILVEVNFRRDGENAGENAGESVGVNAGGNAGENAGASCADSERRPAKGWLLGRNAMNKAGKLNLVSPVASHA